MSTQSTVAETIRHLASAQKPATPGSPPYSVFVNRRLGRVFAAAAYHAGLTPNQVSLISALFTATGIALIALVRPEPWVAVAVTLALVIGYGLDSADGQLARLRGGGSPAGEWLDHVLDAFKASALHLAVLIGWYRFSPPEDAAWLLLPIGYVLVDAGLFFATWITDRMRRDDPAWQPARPSAGPAATTLRRLLLLPTDYGVLTLVMLTLPWRSVFVPLYALMFLGTALFTAAALPKWFREVSRMGRTPAGSDTVRV